MELVLKILRILGYYSDHGDRTARVKVFVVVTLLWVILPGLVYVARYYSSNVGEAMKAFAEVVLLAKMLIHAVKTFQNRVALEQVHEDLEVALVKVSKESNDKIERNCLFMERRLKLLLNGYMGFEMCACLGYLLVPLIVFLIRCLIVDDAILNLPDTALGADFVVFDYKASMMMWLATNLISTVLVSSMMLCGTILDCYSWGLLYRTSELLQMVAMKMICLNEIKDIGKFQKELSNLIDLQEIAIKSARQIEKFLSELLLYLFGVCICVLSAIMLVMSMPNADRKLLMNMGIALSYVSFQLFSYSILGTQLITASTSVAEAIYETDWYERSNSEKKMILFILMRSQKMVTLTIGKCLTVHRATFGAVFKTAFSYYSVLRQFYDE